MKVKLLMIAEIEVEGPDDLESSAEHILDGYRETASNGDWPLSLTRATDDELLQFDVWENRGKRCFVPPVIEESQS